MNRFKNYREIEKRAEAILKTLNARCDRGGCQFHSGHEFCSMDSAWEHAMSRAEDELAEEANAQTAACDNCQREVPRDQIRHFENTHAGDTSQCEACLEEARRA